MMTIIENCPYLLLSATTTVPTMGIRPPSVDAEAERAAAAAAVAGDVQRQVPPAADEEAPAEAAGGERQPPRPLPPPRSGGDAGADPSARKENLKRNGGSEGRMREVQWTISNGNRTMPICAAAAWKRARVFSQNLN